MTLFDGKPIEPENDIMKTALIISASRMTDMPKFYPVELIEAVKSRIDKGIDIHTLVLWTKHPIALLTNPLYDFLINMRNNGVQLYLQCTITGLGKLIVGKYKGGGDLILEPNVPSAEEAIACLEPVVQLLGKPERIRLRVDPIVRIEDAYGNKFSSLKFMPQIIEKVKHLNIKDFSFSFLEHSIHRKVDRRFAKLGVSILPPNEIEREKAAEWFKKLELLHNISISACCVPGFPETRCIDGELLYNLHDNNKNVKLTEPRKRQMCGCTHSIDIGGWPTKKCYSGCQYCYANSSY